MTRAFRTLRLSQLDRNLAPARSLPQRPAAGWLAAVRDALGLTLASLGRRLSISRQSVLELEQAEASDRITLVTLRRVADALGCDLVYTLVPKSGTFAELAERPARESAARDVKRVMQTMALENQKPKNADELLEEEVQRRLNS